MRTRASKPSPMRSFEAKTRRMFRASLIKDYGPYCQLCLAWGRSHKEALIDLEIPNQPKSWSVDHIVPISRGGLNILANMQPAHKECNTIRGNEDL